MFASVDSRDPAQSPRPPTTHAYTVDGTVTELKRTMAATRCSVAMTTCRSPSNSAPVGLRVLAGGLSMAAAAAAAALKLWLTVSNVYFRR